MSRNCQKMFSTVAEVVMHLQKEMFDEECFSLAIHRSNVVNSALHGIERKAFSTKKLLMV